MIRAIFLGSTVLLSACTSLEPLRPDMHARPIPSRIDEVAFINGLRAAYVAYAGPDCYVGTGLKAYRPKFVQGYREYDANAENLSSGQCIRFAMLDANPAVREPLVREYLANGFGLTDLYCNRFFMTAAETRQSRRMQSTTLSGVDTLVTSVFTALGAGTVTTGVLNNTFEAGTATYNNIDASFLVAPDRDDLVKLVQSAQDSIRTQAFTDLPKSYPTARSVIERYASTCTFDGMRALVGVAVKQAATKLADEAAKPKAGDKGNGGATTSSTTVGVSAVTKPDAAAQQSSDVRSLASTPKD